MVKSFDFPAPIKDLGGIYGREGSANRRGYCVSLGEVSYFDGSMGWFGRPETRRKKMRISRGLTTLHFQAA
jgi:hypothetical protein